MLCLEPKMQTEEVRHAVTKELDLEAKKFTSQWCIGDFLPAACLPCCCFCLWNPSLSTDDDGSAIWWI